MINNPRTPGSDPAPATITVMLLPYDTTGKLITPSATNPLQVNVFGAPNGSISPASATITSGTSFSFKYNGQYLANDLLLEAWIADPVPSSTLGKYSIGTTLILRANRQSPANCTYQGTDFKLGTDCTPGTKPGNCSNLTAPGGINVSAAIGSSTFNLYTVDTGSLGLLVPHSEMPAANLIPGESQVVGPGGPGTRSYTSNGGATYKGHYWLAPVTFQLSPAGTVTTHPIKILVVPDSHPLNYLGVGFDRNSTMPDDYINSPADNAFLNLNDSKNGSDISPGYTITPTLITLGITSSSGFDTTPLTANQCVGGDYAGAAGCFSFPKLPAAFCGTMLMDTGIGDMYLNLHPDLRPPTLNQCESDETNCVVPDGTLVQINSGSSTTAPPMCYNFTAGAANPPPITPEPSTVHWSASPDPTEKFVNTGRHPLAWFTYMYDGACGQIGFMPNAEYQDTCE